MNRVVMFRNGKSTYDYVREPMGEEYRSPDEYPYQHDEYWLWREPFTNKASWHQEHSDRMLEHYGERFTAAKRKHIPSWQSATRGEITAFLEEIHPGKGYVATGISAGVNQSNGAPIYTIFYRERDATANST